MKPSEAIGNIRYARRWMGCESDFSEEALDMAIAALEKQEKAYDEWCTDCKEYDHNRHYCPRYNRVIRGAVDEVKQQG